MREAPGSTPGQAQRDPGFDSRAGPILHSFVTEDDSIKRKRLFYKGFCVVTKAIMKQWNTLLKKANFLFMHTIPIDHHSQGILSYMGYIRNVPLDRI